MADWTNSSGCKMRPILNGASEFRIMSFEESTCAATAVIERGDVVSFDTVVTSGGPRLVRAPSSGGGGGNLLQVGIKSLVGVALQGSTSDGSTTGLNPGGKGNSRLRYLSVAVATQQAEFKGWACDNGANPIANSSLIGALRPVIFDGTLQTYFVDSSNGATAANHAVVITGIEPDVIGDSGGFPLRFRFLSTNVSGIIGGGDQ